MNVKIKKLHPDAVIPLYSREGDAGLDLTCIGFESCSNYTEYSTGLAVEIPKGFVGLVFPRSSINDKAQFLGNAVGVIDSGYRGEIKVRMKFDVMLFNAMTSNKDYDIGENDPLYDVGDRVAQLVIMPYEQVNLVEVDELSDSERGEGGFGSTGK